MEFFENFGLNAASIAVVVIAVQSIKSKTGFADWVYIAMTFVFTAIAQLFIVDLSTGWQGIGNSIFFNSLAAAGAYSYAKKIPIINNFINSTENGTENKTPPPPAP